MSVYNESYSIAIVKSLATLTLFQDVFIQKSSIPLLPGGYLSTYRHNRVLLLQRKAQPTLQIWQKFLHENGYKILGL